MNLRRLSYAIGAMGLLATLSMSPAPVAGTSVQEVYVCPPCGADCHHLTFDAPGRCPVCGMELVEKSKIRRAAILIFPGVQIIDFTGPYEVLGQAGFEVYTVAEKKAPVVTAMGMSVNPAHSFEDAPETDILVVPGGGVHSALSSPVAMAWVKSAAGRASQVISVCNGAFILADAGLLDGLEATTYHGLIEELREAAPKTRVVSDRRFVDNGKIITSAGLSAGIDGTLHLVSKILGRERAERIARNLEYRWQPEAR